MQVEGPILTKNKKSAGIAVRYAQRTVIEMPGIMECIETTGSIIEELPLDADKVAGFREQYEVISRRSKDPNFYLSAIGDFSSGKSTLINALIRRKLLKVAHAATTAVPTYIYRGNGDSVVIRAKRDNGEEFDLSPGTDACGFEKRFGVALPERIDERISLLTADKRLSMELREVDIELPDGELANGLCVIDTPGINPGADFARSHAEITKQILNEKADAIIVLFPADQAYTQSFEKFLKDNAEYFMKDAIFVVTMLDRVDEEERDDVIRFVRTNLRNNFHLKDPQVLSCSAMKTGKDPYWTEHFDTFERSLMDKLAKNRQRIVTERLVKLSNELLNSIQSEILSQKNDLEKRLSVLQDHSVPNLIAVLSDGKAAALNALSGIQTAHDTVIKDKSLYLKNRIMQRVDVGLILCDKRSDITKYVNESLASDVEAPCREMYAASAKYTAELNAALDSAISGMIDKLKEYYGEIGGVLPESTTLSASEQQIDLAGKLTGLSGRLGDYEGKIDIATALGGAGLAAIILAGLGPVGWIIGGVAALVGGDRLFVDATRNKVRASVSEKIPEISNQISQELLGGMRANYGKARGALENKADELVSQYQPVYEELERRLDAEKRDLAGQIRHSGSIQDKIKAVLLQMNQIQGGITG